jgi:hypothetical protein
MNDSAYIVGIWLILIIWQQVDAPRYQKGFITASCFSAAAVVVVLIVRTLAKRDYLRYDLWSCCKMRSLVLTLLLESSEARTWKPLK